MAKITVIGLNSIIDKCSEAPTNIDERIKELLHKYGKLMVAYAKNNHNYQNRTGELTRSIKYGVNGLVFQFFLDGNMTVVTGGRKYSTFQHEGTYDGYDQSRFAEGYSSSSGKRGISADHFMVAAFDKYKGEMMRDLKKVLPEVLI